jgi:enoyl-CoA hydratase
MSLVLLEAGPTEGVRVLTLNDPEKRNALSPALQEALTDAIDTVSRDAAARVLVVTGAGTAFSAGADLPAVFGRTQSQEVGEIRVGLKTIYDSFLRVRRLEIPVIAAVNGAAVGAGVNLAMCADLRIAGPHAKFGVTFTKLGLHPGGGCTYFLTQALGRQRALALILDGSVLTAEELRALGLVLEIADDPVAAALEVAGRWAQVDPGLARDIQRSVGIAERGNFDEVGDFESWAQASSARGPQLAEAIARFTR